MSAALVLDHVVKRFGGLHAVREAVDVPVLGIMESGVLTALTLGQRFGVIAILPGSIPRPCSSRT